jgi:hypothetical protein
LCSNSNDLGKSDHGFIPIRRKPLKVTVLLPKVEERLPSND